MLSNLQSAFENMTEDDKALIADGEDPEKQMLLLLAKTKSLKENIQSIQITSEENGKDQGEEPGQ
jgi:hypothetical protein